MTELKAELAELAEEARPAEERLKDAERESERLRAAHVALRDERKGWASEADKQRAQAREVRRAGETLRERADEMIEAGDKLKGRLKRLDAEVEENRPVPPPPQSSAFLLGRSIPWHPLCEIEFMRSSRK